jgi:outer membrane receptor protein involved in Fe transport
MAPSGHARRVALHPLLASPLLALLALALLAVAAPSARAQVGDVTGTIRNGETQEPLDYANVVVRAVSDGAQWGVMSLGGGRFFLRSLPAGKYVLKILYLGYKPVEQEITVETGKSLELAFNLEVTIVKTFEEFVVEGQAVMVAVKDTEFSQTIKSEDLTDYAIDTVEEAVARQAGVVSRAGELHVRGGRSGEVSFRIDGVAVDDPIGGGNVSVGTFAVANINTVTGGQDPEYGNALSGVVDITTKEGGDKFEGGAEFVTDDFGRQDRTYTNFDQFEFGFGGPTPNKKLTYFLSGQLRFSDQENYNRAYRVEHKVQLFGIDLFKFRRRQFNDVRASGKMAYTFSERLKLTAEYTLNYTRSEVFAPNWDVQGFRRELVILPEIEQTSSGYRFTGRFQRVDYGPWVDRMQQMAYPVIVTDEFNERHAVPILEVRNVSGSRVLVAAQPVFQGAKNPLGSKERPGYSTVKADSAYVPFNSANNGPQVRNVSNQAKLVLRHALDEETFYTLKLARLQFLNKGSVLDFLQPYQFNQGGVPSPSLFQGTVPQYLAGSDYYSDPQHPLFVTTSDYPIYNDANSLQWSMRFDVTSSRYSGHKLKAGVQTTYNDLQQISLFNPAIERQNRFSGEWSQGGNRNIFHTYNPEASFYMQDRWEYEGMVISGGFRWDLFSPGSAAKITVDNEDVNRNVARFKSQFSPRLGFAFPITDRDGFHFHYGRFIQFPDRSVLFASQDPIGNLGTLGNPNLESELTISYQAGVKHQFSDYVAGQVAIYNKDIYGLIAATQVTDQTTGNTLARYINKAYANARGIEFTLERRFADRWGFDVTYTYSFADGVASSQEFGSNPDGLQFLPNQELPLDWDRRHSLNMSLRLAEPDQWAASLLFSYGAGFPWTPNFRFEKRQDPLLENSRRLPSEYSLDLQAERHVNVYGQKLTLYLQGFNLINQDVVVNIAPAIFPGTIDGTPAYTSYLTETGKYGGAYLQDVDGDQIDDFTPVNDPRVFDQHRLFRIGVGWQF